MYRSLYKIGFIAYAILLVLSVVFYKERIVLLDNSFFLFDILRTGDFVIHHNRFIAVLTEVYPLLASKLSLPIDAVVRVYSIAFIINYIFFYIICGYVLKNYKMALVVLLFSVLMTTHTFYWGISELPLGIAMIMPLFALVTDRERKVPNWMLFLLLPTVLITIAFAHPLIVFPLLFFAAFIFISPEIKKNKILVVAMTVTVLLLFYIKDKFFTDAYDAKSSEVTENLFLLFPNYFDLYSNKRFIANWLDIYYWVPVAFLVILLVYFFQKKWLKLLLVLAFCVGYTLFINVCYYTVATEEFYIENLYYPIPLFLAVPLVYDVFPVLKGKKLATPLFVLILLTGIIRIYVQRDFYRGRVDWLRGYMDTHMEQKTLAPANTAPHATLLFTWATPYEFWLLSTLERDKSASIIFSEDVNSLKWGTEDPKAFLTTWGLFPYETLDKRYFKFTDTISTYVIEE